jgi:hypothetical protein
MQPILRQQGIDIAFPRRQESGQLIRISKVQLGEASSAVDLEVGKVDCTMQEAMSMIAPTKIDRQIDRGEQNKEEAITLSGIKRRL